MRFLIVFHIDDDRLHVMYDSLENLAIDGILGQYIKQIENLKIHQHALINSRYFVERVA